MLSRSICDQIKQCGLSTLHDYWFTSLFAGEPRFQDGVLSYYDGRLVTLCGFPLRGNPPIDGPLVRRLVEKWIGEDPAVQAVCYVGPNRVDLSRLRKFSFRCVSEQPAIPIASELFIDCNGQPDSVLKKRIYRRSRSLSFERRVRSAGSVSAEHFQLIEFFYRKRQVTTYLAEIAFAIPVLLRSRRVHLIEARKDGKLCGFIALHKPFLDISVGLFMACRPDIPGVCDFLYSAMLDESKRLGATSVNVGPSPSLGHFNFKKKWGGEPVVPPYYFVQWARGLLAQRFHTSWGPRMVRL